MINNLLDSPTIGTLERVLNFTEARHQVILENLANVSTPGYVQKDVSVAEFQKSLQDALDTRQSSDTDIHPTSTATTVFGSDGNGGVQLKPRSTVTSSVFHDRGVRSMESLMSQLADNATAHNMAAQMLRNRYDILARAISMRA